MPDDSTQFVLREVDTLTQGRNVHVRRPCYCPPPQPWQIHAISFNCETATAADFLRDLAHAHHGRFHFFERQPQLDDSPVYYDFSTGARIISISHADRRRAAVRQLCRVD